MVKAPPFPPSWGFDQLINNNKTNILNASIEAWKNAGKELNATTGLPISPTSMGMGASIMFGMLPFVLGTLVYMRLQKLWPATLVILLSTGGLHVFGLIQGKYLWAVYIILSMSLALSVVYAFFNKD